MAALAASSSHRGARHPATPGLPRRPRPHGESPRRPEPASRSSHLAGPSSPGRPAQLPNHQAAQSLPSEHRQPPAAGTLGSSLPPAAQASRPSPNSISGYGAATQSNAMHASLPDLGGRARSPAHALAACRNHATARASGLPAHRRRKSPNQSPPNPAKQTLDLAALLTPTPRTRPLLPHPGGPRGRAGKHPLPGTGNLKAPTCMWDVADGAQATASPPPSPNSTTIVPSKPKPPPSDQTHSANSSSKCPTTIIHQIQSPVGSTTNS